MMTLSYSDILRSLIVATAPVVVAAPVCSCWACRQSSADLAPVPDVIVDAVEEFEGWGNEDGEGAYCADCRAQWQSQYGESADAHHIYDRGIDRAD